MTIRTALALLALTGLAACVSAQEATVVEAVSNPGFDDGMAGWSTWPEDSTTTVSHDTEIMHSGNGSLRLDGTSPSGRMFVLQTSTAMQTGHLYRVSAWIRKDRSIPDSAIGFLVNYRKIDDASISKRSDAWDVQKQTEGEWTRWSGLFLTELEDVNWQVLLRLEYAVGSVWFDDLLFEDLGDPGVLTPEMWSYVPLGVEIGSPPGARFAAHREANDAAYQMATRYNDLMMREGVAEAKMRDAERVLAYAGIDPPPTLRQSFVAAESLLNDCYLAFTVAFRSGEDTDVAAFGDAATAAETGIGELETTAGTVRGTMSQTPEQMPEHLGEQSRDISPFDENMRMNRLLTGVWSPNSWQEFEEAYGFEFHSGYNTGIAREYDGVTADFSNITEACDSLVEQGYAGTFSMLPFGQHDVIWAPEAFIDANADDDDIWKTSWDGERGRSRGSYYGLNYYHPAVREHIATYLQKIATFVKDEPRVFFYETSQEALPYFGCDKGRRETGYGPSATVAFHAWLRDEYGDIATLNLKWGSEYANFEAIVQPPDRFAQPDREIGPLVAEFERFREDTYIDYLKLIYDSVKAGDTTKPVAARHSSLLTTINGARIYETCDILGYHSRAPRMQVMHLYLNTLARVNDKPLAYLEDFWGCQQESDRISDERAQRRGAEKHVARAYAWGRTLQMKWYAYTSGSYLTSYNGNWFNPRYDVLTMRYCAPALKVALDRMRNLDWVLTHSRIPAFRVCVWQPSASMRIQARDGLSAGEIVDLHRIIYPAGFPYELVPEEYFADGREKLEDYDVVFMPCAEYLSEDHQRRLAAWVKAGGTLFAFEPPGVKDELTRPSGLLLRNLYGIVETSFDAETATWSYTIVGDTEPMSDKWGVGVGTGEVWVCPTTFGRWHASEAHHRALVARLEELVTRLAYSDEARFEVVMRVTDEGDRYLFVLNPDPDESATDRVIVNQAVSVAVDVSVADGFPVPVEPIGDGGAMNVTLGPCETAIIWLGRE